MFRLLVLAVSLLLLTTAGAGAQSAQPSDPADEYRDQQQNKRAIERHTPDTRAIGERQRRKARTEAEDEDGPEGEKGEAPKDKKPQ